MTSPSASRSQSSLCLCLCVTFLAGGQNASAQPASAQPAPSTATATAPAAASSEPGERILAIYLPGLYFSQLSGKVELGAELAEHLSRSLGQKITSRIYATAEALENDAPRITLALVESPYAATRLGKVTPVCVASANGKEETRLLVLAGPRISDTSDLHGQRLAYASLSVDEQAFLENFVFEGELPLAKEQLEPARDAASALSKITLKKAEAVLLYEDDAPRGKQINLRPIYETASLPRPTLVSLGHLQAPEQQRLRDAMVRFAGHSHPQLRSFRAAVFDKYQSLQLHIQRRNQRLPPLLELSKDQPVFRVPPAPTPALPQPSLRLYAPPVPAVPAP